MFSKKKLTCFVCYLFLFAPFNLFADYEPTTSNCCFDDCWPRFYIEFEGGWTTGWGRRQRGNDSGGGLFTGRSRNGTIESGYTIGAHAGFWFSPYVRADVSYSFFQNRYKWDVEFPFPSAPGLFLASLQTQMVLFNIYLHSNGLIRLPCGLDPYIVLGKGVALNRLYNIREFGRFVTGDVFVSDVLEYKERDSAAHRVGVGLSKNIWNCLFLDLGFIVNYVGQIRTGDRRLFAGNLIPIGPYVFPANWTKTVKLGARYIF